ncbi:MAG TPA: bifunctional phosphopantothenoylcysteine decarboxylase/phosphopantothenate--cysteine ligase CoaBC [Sphingobacterium sp.]|nr:bifunctional phosphopantothenoylcysteine decarboxylase/phosphopantothenate--cysteine ligase CoaBC [Sphingobacterium sp.]
MALEGKKIVLGICGSISAYKAAELTRLFIKKNAEVQIIMTEEAKAFISPLTLSTLSKRPVLSHYYDKESGEWNNHVKIAAWADVLLIAPITAHTLGKLAHGLCDTLLEAVYLSCTCPVVLSPAMDLDMWKHAATQQNIQKLNHYGNFVIPPDRGELASGLSGEGRLPEPEKIRDFIKNIFLKTASFKGKKVLVTAGPTYEPLDPVRFIGNHSSGKMGYAIAKNLQKRGADVTLISGPTSLNPIDTVETLSVTTAEEMYKAVEKRFTKADITIMSAAVADYTPKVNADHKIKKEEASLSLELVKTKDILAEMGKRKKKNQLLIGFALETQNAIENAKAKLKRKNLDLIVLNTLEDEGAGFGYDTNQVTILDKEGEIQNFPIKSKDDVANDLLDILEKRL